MRRRVVVVGLALSPVLAGCALVGLVRGDQVDGRQVTFRGTAEAGSMAPTIEIGDRVVATEVDASGPEVGDVVVYRNPGRWLAIRDEGEGQLVHRVLGTPGDTIVCCDTRGRLEINGAPLDEPYIALDQSDCNAVIFAGPTQPGSRIRGECDWEVGPIPDGKLFVLGDNRDNAADSRFHLCPAEDSSCTDSPWVPVDLVQGVVVLP